MVRKIEELGRVDAIRSEGGHLLGWSIKKERFGRGKVRSERVRKPAIWRGRILLETWSTLALSKCSHWRPAVRAENGAAEAKSQAAVGMTSTEAESAA